MSRTSAAAAMVVVAESLRNQIEYEFLVEMPANNPVENRVKLNKSIG
jgi:hypothetical protein